MSHRVLRPQKPLEGGIPGIIHRAIQALVIRHDLDEVCLWALQYLTTKEQMAMKELAQLLREGEGYSYRSAQRAATELVRVKLATRLRKGIYQANFWTILNTAEPMLAPYVQIMEDRLT